MRMTTRVWVVIFMINGKKTVDNSKIHAKIFKNIATQYEKEAADSADEREGTVRALGSGKLRATFVRPERSGRVLPIQSGQDAVTSAKQGGTARERPCA